LEKNWSCTFYIR